MKFCFFTFDYELFLGTDSKSSGNLKETLIDPTNEILDLFDKFNITNSIFFLDTLFINRMKNEAKYNENIRKELIFIKGQLKRIIKSGHYVFPHIHAHWLDAFYDKKIRQWFFPNFDKYRFHDLSRSEQHHVFDISIQIMEEIYENEIWPEHMGYRAGGWCIQPFSDFKAHFEKYNIKYDFSVMPGSMNVNFPWKYNFKSKIEYDLYKFSNDVLEMDSEGPFIEVPISCIDTNYLFNALVRITGVIQNKLSRPISHKSDRKILKSNESHMTFLNFIVEKLKNNNNSTPISIERLNILSFLQYYIYIKKNRVIHFISHPKLISNSQIQLLSIFLVLIKKEKIDFNFMNLQPVKN